MATIKSRTIISKNYFNKKTFQEKNIEGCEQLVYSNKNIKKVTADLLLYTDYNHL